MSAYQNRGQSESDVGGVVEPIAGILGHGGGSLPELVLCGPLPLVLVLALPLSLCSVEGVPRLHVTCVICLLQLEVGVVVFPGVPLLLLGHLVFLGEEGGGVRARQRVDVRRESPVVGMSFLPLNMVCLAVVSLHILTLLHHV